jgi:site-specific DNA-methyltransferase (cytosine-N4-specific)
LKPHPARFPAELPEFFIRMLTNEGDLVIDPFAGSCVTGEVCERLNRKWVCAELRKDYVEAARGRFAPAEGKESKRKRRSDRSQDFYRIARPSVIWDRLDQEPISDMGGRKSTVEEDNSSASSTEEGSDRNAA